MTQDEVRGYRGHLIEPCLTIFPLDIKVFGEPEAPVRLQAGLGRLPRGFGRQQLRHVGGRAAGFVRVEQMGHAVRR